MVKIFFRTEFPANYRVWAERLVRKYELLFPIWLQEVNMSWTVRSENWAGMTLNKDYRKMDLTIDSNLAEASAEFQQETIIHEICHCFTHPQLQIAMDMLQRAYPEGREAKNSKDIELYSIWEEKIVNVCEGVNTDFAYSVSRLLSANANSQ